MKEGIYLEFSDEKSDKFYEMTDNEDGTFTATYGRVGAANPQSADYDIELWDKKLKEKLKKGYEVIA